MSASQSGTGGTSLADSSAGDESSRRPSTDMSFLPSHTHHSGQSMSNNRNVSSSNNSSNNNFSSYFLAAAATASVLAEAARTGGQHSTSHSSSSSLSSQHSSSSTSTAQPLPYLAHHTPFPLVVGNRIASPSLSTYSSLKGKQREQVDELGRVRCCWAILSTRSERLEFLYVDSTFSEHLGSKADSITGTSFFDYIHLEEEERTRVDMRNIIQSRTLFGSVTRCRYSNLAHIKSTLEKGGKSEDSSKSLEANYLPIDIVVNWIGEDMALCFFHAIIDESPQDNDEHDKTDWSNWCGMKNDSMLQEECQMIWRSIQSHRPLIPTKTGPQYVFQVLSAVPSLLSNDSTPNILFSWPPPRLFNTPSNEAITASAINFTDGSYFADDFARLAQGVDQLTHRKELSDANTSCTRRFRAKHTLTTENMIRSVESVLIPYGSIVLACFSVTYVQIMPSSSVDIAASRRASIDTSYADYDRSSSYTTQQEDSFSHNKNVGSASSFKSVVDLDKKEEQDNNGQILKTSKEKAGTIGQAVTSTSEIVASAASAQNKTCASCGTSHSPEWRKGPDGTKSLCNACGLRFSRNISRARKRDERARIAAEVAANGGIIPPHLRKKPGEEKVKRSKKAKIISNNSTEAISNAPLGNQNMTATQMNSGLTQA